MDPIRVHLLPTSQECIIWEPKGTKFIKLSEKDLRILQAPSWYDTEITVKRIRNSHTHFSKRWRVISRRPKWNWLIKLFVCLSPQLLNLMFQFYRLVLKK